MNKTAIKNIYMEQLKRYGEINMGPFVIKPIGNKKDEDYFEEISSLLANGEKISNIATVEIEYE